MIADLAGAGEQAADADLLVIGGGTAGLTIAAKVAACGLRVICLESGGRSQKADEHPFNEVVHSRAIYGGAAAGRFRCLGGTSTRWGGALIPFQERDLDHHHWPTKYPEILRYQLEVEHFFGLSQGPYDLPDELGRECNFVARLAKWPPFARRNVASLLSAEIKARGGPKVWINATATDFDMCDDRVDSVIARALDGSSIRVRARQVVIAAGAIESTRLLLLLDRQNAGTVCAPDDELGRNFYDHLSVAVGHLEVCDRRALSRLVGFRFEPHGAMRNLRFELTNDSPLRASMSPCFAHVKMVDDGRSGFAALRDVFQYVQRRSLPPLSSMVRLAGAAPWLARATWWRYVHRRFLYPADARLEVHMVIEQVPDPDNRIRLSAGRTDAFNRPLAEIAWAPGRADIDNLTASVDALQRTWDGSKLSELAKFVRRPPEEAGSELAMGDGIYHPGGSTRMADKPEQGVVDADLALFRCPNVSVVATSVLPNGGGANPTMMLMMLAFRCVDRLTRLLRSEPDAMKAS